MAEAADWKRMRFKRNKVWLALDEKGAPLERDGKVLIKYQLNQDYEYWVHRAAVRPLEAPTTEPAVPSPGRRRAAAGGEAQGADAQAAADDPGAVKVYTDGASSGNPGPAGIGVVLQYGPHEKEISRYIGTATNNVAELEAILAGLRAVKDKRRPVRLFTDSGYAHGLLVLGWKPRANQELVAAIRREMARFADLSIHKVRGHAGLPQNERADRLATDAIRHGASGS